MEALAPWAAAVVLDLGRVRLRVVLELRRPDNPSVRVVEWWQPSSGSGISQADPTARTDLAGPALDVGDRLLSGLFNAQLHGVLGLQVLPRRLGSLS